MKNVLILDIDFEREKPLIIGKPPEIPQPTNDEEAKKMIDLDILSLCEGIASIINIIDHNGYGTRKDTLEKVIEYLKSICVEPNKIDAETPTTTEKE